MSEKKVIEPNGILCPNCKRKLYYASSAFKFSTNPKKQGYTDPKWKCSHYKCLHTYNRSMLEHYYNAKINC